MVNFFLLHTSASLTINENGAAAPGLHYVLT